MSLFALNCLPSTNQLINYSGAADHHWVIAMQPPLSAGDCDSIDAEFLDRQRSLMAGMSMFACLNCQLFALNCLPSTVSVCPQMFALKCLPSTVRLPQLTL